MATKFYANPIPETPTVRNLIPATAGSGDVRFFESVHTATGTEHATDDSIVIARLPVGAVVIPELSAVAQEASLGGSAVAIPKIGDAGDDDRYSATSITLHSTNAAVTAVTPNVGASVIPRFTVTEETRDVIAAFARTNALTAGKKILFRIAYRLGH